MGASQRNMWPGPSETTNPGGAFFTRFKKSRKSLQFFMVVPNNHGKTPTKNDHFGVFWGILLVFSSPSPPILHGDVSKNSGLKPPKSSIFHRVFHYTLSILGYPYFWKHPILHGGSKGFGGGALKLLHQFLKILDIMSRVFALKTSTWNSPQNCFVGFGAWVFIKWCHGENQI